MKVILLALLTIVVSISQLEASTQKHASQQHINKKVAIGVGVAGGALIVAVTGIVILKVLRTRKSENKYKPLVTFGDDFAQDTSRTTIADPIAFASFNQRSCAVSCMREFLALDTIDLKNQYVSTFNETHAAQCGEFADFVTRVFEDYKAQYQAENDFYSMQERTPEANVFAEQIKAAGTCEECAEIKERIKVRYPSENDVQEFINNTPEYKLRTALLRIINNKLSILAQIKYQDGRLECAKKSLNI